MSHEIFMPALSSTMTEGKIVEWLKNPGDKVERGESVLVVESDKADMDVESFQDGYLAAVLMPAGSTAPVGETIGLIVENEDEIASVQEQNKGNQPEVSSSDQLELVSNKTEEKPVAQSEIVEVKDGKLRSKDDPTSWPLTFDQPDPVISPKPESEVDNAGDNATKPLKKSKPTTTSLNPNVPEFIPMASKVI